MSRLLSIAFYTFREAIRNKILYSIVFFAVVLMFIAVVLGEASLHQDARILRNLGLTSTSIFANLIGLFLGVTLVYQELERKTIYNVLSKPLPRPLYFFGKFLGIALTLAVQLVVMAATLLIAMALRGDPMSLELAYAFWLIFVESLLIIAFALLFSSFSTPYVSGYLTLGVWLVGRLIQELAAVAPRLDDAWVRQLVQFFVLVCPDLSLFNLQTQLSNQVVVPLSYVLHASLYGLGYASLALIAGAALFNRRDFI
jgi:ABC-type transport system involved in multi-copper enzyme maturation permease subunit